MKWLFFLLLTLTVIAGEKEKDVLKQIKKSQWKHRLILVHDPEKSPDWARQIAAAKAGLKERHLKLIPVTPVVMKQYKIEAGTQTLILIGKDGGVKARQYKSFNLAKLFKIIDQMPMRRREMKEQTK